MRWPVGSVSPCPIAFMHPELDGIHLERDGELVHLRLGGEAGLHGAEATHRAAGRVVGEDGAALDERVGHVVGAGGERGGVRADRGRARGVGAAVEQDLHADVRELAVARGAVLAPDARRVAVDVAGEGLLAVVDHLHRAVGLQGEHRAVDLHGEVLAPAEGAADAGEVDAHLRRRQAEARCDLVAVDVEPLRRDVDVHAALAVRNGQARFGPEEGLVLDPELVVRPRR